MAGLKGYVAAAAFIFFPVLGAIGLAESDVSLAGKLTGFLVLSALTIASLLTLVQHDYHHHHEP